MKQHAKKTLSVLAAVLLLLGVLTPAVYAEPLQAHLSVIEQNGGEFTIGVILWNATGTEYGDFTISYDKDVLEIPDYDPYDFDRFSKDLEYVPIYKDLKGASAWLAANASDPGTIKCSWLLDGGVLPAGELLDLANEADYPLEENDIGYSSDIQIMIAAIPFRFTDPSKNCTTISMEGNFNESAVRASWDVWNSKTEQSDDPEPEEPAELPGDNSCGAAAYWSVTKDGTLVISGKGSTYEYWNDPSTIPWLNADPANEEKIRNIRIEEGVSGIGGGTFIMLPNVEGISVPASVKELNIDCSYKTLTVSEDNPAYTAVDSVLFNKEMTELLAHPYLPGANYTVPDGVKTVSGGSFAEAASVVYPASVEVINAGARTMYVYNPTCDFGFFALEGIPGGIVIHGEKDSTAEALASEWGATFIPLSGDFVISGAGIQQKGNHVFSIYGNNALDILRCAGDGAKLFDAEGAPVTEPCAVRSGMVIEKADGTRLPVIVPGDNTGDGEIEVDDARFALRQAVGLEHFNDWQTAASLLSGGDEVEVSDARMILRAAVGLEFTEQWIPAPSDV